MRHVRWVFFDMGSTLIDETACYAHRVRDAIAGSGLRAQDVWRLCVAYAKENRAGDREALLHLGLPRTPWHGEDETPYPEAKDVLRALCLRGYRIDNDIAPAKALGMRTIHVRQGLGAYHSARHDGERADNTVDRLTQVPDILTGHIP